VKAKPVTGNGRRLLAPAIFFAREGDGWGLTVLRLKALAKLPPVSEYNLQMRLGVLTVSLVLVASISWAQAGTKGNPATGGATAERGLTLAEGGRCTEALPILKRAIRSTPDRELQKKIGLAGIQCAMTHGAPYDSLVFLDVLNREFPNDPEVLYAATHAFSDLSLLTSQTLARQAPFSYQIHLLNAEALEVQGKWQEAAAEYRKIIEINPVLPGIHARLGRTLLAQPQPSPDTVAQAKKSFEDELEIDPRNASAEYVLGELARSDNDLSAATLHYTRATNLDQGFAEAYLGLGMSLVSAKRFAEAIPPLEKYEKLAPDSPTGHYQLAMAYAGAGRREDANREAALQRETAASLEKVKRRVAEGLEAPQGSTPAPNAEAPK
jgi:tetratricopeptide (TPR) repeat protein